MTITDLESALKSAGYSTFKRDSATRLIIYTSEDRKQLLLLLAKSLPKARYLSQKNGPGWKSSAGAVMVQGLMIIAKPGAKEGVSGSLGQLDARKFSGTAKNRNGGFSYHGVSVASVEFTSAKQIEAGIIKGCRETPFLGESVAEVFEDFFETGKITWPAGFPIAVINKLGVYLGELLIGWVYLKGRQGRHIEGPDPFKGKAKTFIMPTDPAFSGVDSFLEMDNGKYYAISSKAGIGAAASFFSNLMKAGMMRYAKLPKSPFRDMCELAVQNNLQYKDARSLVYLYGVRHLLEIGPTKLKDPNKAYEQLKAKKLGPEAKMVVMGVRFYPKLKQEFPAIIEKLPWSVSAFFTRYIAKDMNEHKVARETIAEILAGKDYWQANLNLREWLKGSLKFSILRSGKASVTVRGDKAALGDISASQGWVNYILKYDK